MSLVHAQDVAQLLRKIFSWVSECGPGRGAHHEVRVYRLIAAFWRLAREHLLDDCEGFPAKLLAGNADGGQWWGDKPGERDVVGAEHGDVLWYTQAGPRKGLDCADGSEVIAAEDGRGHIRAGEQIG